MDGPEFLRRKASDYETRAASHDERAGLDPAEHVGAAMAFAIVAIVLHELAEVFEEHRELAA